VRAAHRLGYTEPDPRDDLGGIDVARKALVLARMLGWPLELTDVTVETLYPAALAGMSVPQFLKGIEVLDEPYAMRLRAAQAAGEVLRNRAEVRDGRCQVGMEPVAPDSPLGRLQGTDNLIAFHTARYATSPLVVQGPGAGAEVTAAGILADILAVAALC
jgi:homoserine dehydrogenase